MPTLSVAGASVPPPCSVSTSRSSNRACGFPAHGSPTGFARQHTMARSSFGRDPNDSTIFADKQSSFRDRSALNGVDRQSQSPGCWSLPETRQKSGSFPPPALPGFISTTNLSATPKAAQSAPHGVLVESHNLSPLGLPVLRVVSSCRHAVVTTPVEPSVLIARSSPDKVRRHIPRERRPSPLLKRLGFHVTRFEACSTFTHVTACPFADPPRGPFLEVLQSNSLPP